MEKLKENMALNHRLTMECVLKSRNKAITKKLYLEAFPKAERMPFPMMLGMSALWHTHFYNFYDEETFCGFVYTATVGRQTFIMYLAVEEALRNKGYGSRILQMVKEKFYKNMVVVSIAPCFSNAEDLELRKRRKKFYERCGFRDTGYMIDMEGKQEILVVNGVFSKAKLRRFFALYSNFTLWPKIWKRDCWEKNGK